MAFELVAPPQPSEKDYSAHFEQIWEIYPARLGTNSKKAAFRKYMRTIRNGSRFEHILAGTRRYADFCAETNIEYTPYVMQAVRFFGINEHWRSPYAIPKKGLSHQDAADLNNAFEIFG